MQLHFEKLVVKEKKIKALKLFQLLEGMENNLKKRADLKYKNEKIS